MTLFRQIQLLITALLLIMLMVVLSLTFNNARTFVRDQLYTDAKNTANSLSLSLSTVTGEPAIMETMINAMFDGGYFEEITLLDAEGKVVHTRTQIPVIEGVPERFIEMVPLTAPDAEAQVSSGWTIFGTLRVKGHPGHSYIQLWETFLSLGFWFAGLVAGAFIVSYFLLKFVLSSLDRIRKQAEAIEQNEFIIQADIPKTPELKKVVIAMNRMVAKVQVIYDKEINTLKQYQELLYKDGQTGLYNRRYFINQLNDYLQAEDSRNSGELHIIYLDGAEDALDAVGHPVMDAFYKECRTILNETELPAGSVVARLKDNEFALLIPAVDPATGNAAAQSIHARISGYMDTTHGLSDLMRAKVSITAYQFGDTLPKLMSMADYSLSVAKANPGRHIERFNREANQTVLGKQEWKQLLEEAFAERRFQLTAQPVLSSEDELHQEVYINLVDKSGTVQRAGYFMPMVISLDLANSLDRYVFEQAAEFLTHDEKGILAINISVDFLKDRNSFAWFRQYLGSVKHLKHRLAFEITDSAITANIDVCLDFGGMMRGMGFTFGVDRFTLSEHSLGYLQQLKPHYLKIDQSYLLDLESKDSSDAALKSLQTVAESLDIKLIATMVEDSEQRVRLESKNIQYFQGRGVAEIVPLKGGNDE